MTPEEVKTAQRGFLPVVYKGMLFDRITERIVKIVKGHAEGTYKELLCVRLLHERSNSTTVAQAKDVAFAPSEENEKEIHQ